jgi:hypothetical protein
MSKCLGVIFIYVALYFVILLDGSVVYIGTEQSNIMVPDINMEEMGF